MIRNIYKYYIQTKENYRQFYRFLKTGIYTGKKKIVDDGGIFKKPKHSQINCKHINLQEKM